MNTADKSTEVWFGEDNFQETKVVERDLPELGNGQIRVAIEFFGLTSNNVGYALSGKSIGYNGYFPAEAGWIKVPVWGCAKVIQSKSDDIAVGERLYGFLPMASHLDMEPKVISDTIMMDAIEHRQALPVMYNAYQRMNFEPEALKPFDVERSLLIPLFTTSFVLADYLEYHDFFGAQQIVIGSVSSKTGFGLAKMLKENPAVTQKIVGVTSSGNREFVEGLNACDQVVVYGNETDMDASLSTAYVDMSGDVGLTERLHNHVGDNVVESAIVGGTHWNAIGKNAQLPGAKPTFFFAPAHIGMRDKEWGMGGTFQRGTVAGLKIAAELASELSIDWTRDAEGLRQVWSDMLDNKISGKNGQMITLLQE